MIQMHNAYATQQLKGDC